MSESTLEEREDSTSHQELWITNHLRTHQQFFNTNDSKKNVWKE